MVRMCSARTSSWSVVRQRSTEVARGTDQRSRSAAPRKCVQMRYREAETESAARARHTTGTQDLLSLSLSINTRSARGVATPKSHFGELDSSQDSSCRPLNDGGQQLEPSAFRVRNSRCGSGEATGPTTAAASRELRPQILFLGRQRPGASAPTRIQRQLNLRWTRSVT